MNQKFGYALGLSAALLLAACAVTGSTRDQRFGQIGHYLAQHGQSVAGVLLYDAPSAGSPISNAMLIGAAQVSTSLPSVQLIAERMTQGQTLAVTSASPSLALAYVRAAVRSVPSGQHATVYVLADRDETLEKTAAEKGIRLIFVPTAS